MILYLDTSALAKRYLAERGSAEVEALIQQADAIGTSLITRAEVSAAIAKAVRTSALTRPEGEKILRAFRRHWPEVGRLQISETLIADADTLAWTYSLRGYDAIHLASARLWQEALSEAVTLATFDRQLWAAAQQAGMDIWPERLE
jgi:predicted nucleic acid-binding protein